MRNQKITMFQAGIGSVKCDMEMIGPNPGVATRLQSDPMNLKMTRANMKIRRNFFTIECIGIVDHWKKVPTEIKNLPME